MKTPIALLIIVVLLTGVASAEQQRIISHKNEYGGKTIEVNMEPGDKGYDVRIMKVIDYYQKKTEIEIGNRLAKREIFFTNAFANQEGVNRAIQYHDSSGKMTRKDFFYTERWSKERGAYRDIGYYNSNEEIIRLEVFYTKTFAKERGYDRKIKYSDSNGKKLDRVEYFMGKRLTKPSLEEDEFVAKPIPKMTEAEAARRVAELLQESRSHSSQSAPQYGNSSPPNGEDKSITIEEFKKEAEEVCVREILGSLQFDPVPINVNSTVQGRSDGGGTGTMWKKSDEDVYTYYINVQVIVRVNNYRGYPQRAGYKCKMGRHQGEWKYEWAGLPKPW